MLALLIVLIVVGSVAYRMTTSEERARIFGNVRQHLGPVIAEATRGRLAMTPFRDALRARTRWVVVTPTIAALNLIVFAKMVLGDGGLGEPTTLVAWGGSFGPLTTNGDWWRLVTAMFVHAGLLHLLANLIGLVQVGLMLERLVGPVTFACLYVAAGVFANLVSLAEYPLAVHVGASGAIFGIYGVLLAVTAWTLVRRRALTIPLMAYQSLAPSAALFFLYCMATDGLVTPPNVRGFLVGLVGGLVLTKDIGERKPATRPIAIAVPIALVISIYFALPLRGLVDVRPQIALVVLIEDRTAEPYKRAVDRLTTGRSNVEVLTEQINDKIMPEFHAARARIKALDGVHREHQPMVADAEEYLRLRETSWRLRVEGLRKGNVKTLREADRLEHASLQALRRLKAMRLTPEVRS